MLNDRRGDGRIKPPNKEELEMLLKRFAPFRIQFAKRRAAVLVFVAFAVSVTLVVGEERKGRNLSRQKATALVALAVAFVELTE